MEHLDEKQRYFIFKSLQANKSKSELLAMERPHSQSKGHKLIRQYLPKGTDFANVTPEDIRKIEDKLNNRPRKRLDYMTPKEYILHKFNILLR